MKIDNIFKIEPRVQHYAWGGSRFIPNLIGQQNEGQEPFAELWMGDHPKAPAGVKVGGDNVQLSALITSNPIEFLGEKSWQIFGPRMPFLFKVLDVEDMLSIQTHPTKKQAEIGFDKEESSGIPLLNFDRVFKDDNHKPELMVALSEFWLLHGFRPLPEILTTLNSFSSLSSIYQKIQGKSIAAIYEYFMRMPQAEIENLLVLLKRELEQLDTSDKQQPHFWASRAFEKFGLDRGIFSIYLFNLVVLQPGQAIFQQAGIPHAYLEGQNVEIMANSDNVFRGGLTQKYMNVDLLMDHLITESVVPEITSGASVALGVHYPDHVQDFALFRIQKPSSFENDSASIILVLDGELGLNEHKFLPGEVVYIKPNSSVEMSGRFDGFLATTRL